MMHVERVRNPEWLKLCYSVQRETAMWFLYRCTYCQWEWAATTAASRIALDGRLALHLVLCHVDLAELLV